MGCDGIYLEATKVRMKMNFTFRRSSLFRVLSSSPKSTTQRALRLLLACRVRFVPAPGHRGLKVLLGPLTFSQHLPNIPSRSPFFTAPPPRPFPYFYASSLSISTIFPLILSLCLPFIPTQLLSYNIQQNARRSQKSLAQFSEHSLTIFLFPLLPLA